MLIEDNHTFFQEYQSIEKKTYKITILPGKEIYQESHRIEFILKGLMKIGEGFVYEHTSNSPVPEKSDSLLFYTKWTVVLTTKESLSAIKSVFHFIQDFSIIDIQVVDTY